MTERNEDTEHQLVQRIDEVSDGHDYESIGESVGYDEDDLDDMDGHDREGMIEEYVSSLSNEQFQEEYNSYFSE